MDKLTMKIGKRIIGEGEPVFIIAEIGVNHNGSLQIAKKLIDAAVSAGADAVKFQKRSLKHLYQEKVLENPNANEQSFQYMIPLLKEWELSDEEYQDIVKYCDEKGIIFLCSPWDIPSVDFVNSLGVPVFKTASADLTNLILLDYIISKNKPLIISTGMATVNEIECTVDFLRERGAEFALLHCNSTYPSPFEEINLRFMEKMKSEFGPVLIGYSGHERGIAISTAAAALGACIIERHITLDRTMAGPDHAASLEPQGLQKMVRDIRYVEAAMGSGKKHMNRMEILNREVIAKSLIATQDISKGTIITREMIGVKSPGKGISPQRMGELVGKTLPHDIMRDEFFKFEDLKNLKGFKSISKDFGKWGFVFRPHDAIEVERINAPAAEIRLSDKDTETPFPEMGFFKQELIVHAPEYWHRSLLDISSLDESAREKSVEVTKKVIEKTKELAGHFQGVPKIVIHPGGISMEYIGQSDKLNANMERSLKALDTPGVVLLPENMPPRPWFFGGEYFCNNFLDAYEIKEFCEKYNRKICFDLCHAQLYCNLNHKDIIEFIKVVKPYIGHMHIADAYGVHGEGIQIEEGDIDFKSVIPILFKGYKGSWIPEIWRGHQENFKGYYVAMERLSKYWRF